VVGLSSGTRTVCVPETFTNRKSFRKIQLN
jgi:hypothetical protein